MANYAVSNSTGITFGGTPRAISAAYNTIAVVGNGSSNSGSAFSGATAATPYIPRRGKLYDILIGQPSTPGDTSVQWDVMRGTAISTNIFVGALTSASSLFALDGADSPANSAIYVNSSAEIGTYVADIWNVAINQRASYRWVAAPGSELVWPATSSNGLALRAIQGAGGGGGYVGLVSATLLVQEQ
jgi:hypothetical protein